MKVKHIYTSFEFEVDGDKYTVQSNASKHGQNSYAIYGGGIYIAQYSTAMGHVNKTNAERILRKAIFDHES